MKIKSLLSVLTVLMLAACAAYVAPRKPAPKPLDMDENPLILFYAITGSPTKQALADHLAKIRKSGITQLMIYPRTGLEIEYMSPQWLDTVKFMVDECKRLGYTSVWLYDEFNWPSGTANHKVMAENPDYALTQMSVYKDADGKYSFKVRKNMGAADLLNRDAVKCFIRLTHERYYNLLKDDFGSIIRGIFSDEPAVTYFDKSDNAVLRVPYYAGIEADYEKLTGRNFRDDLVKGSFRAGLSKLVGARMAENYIGTLEDWTSRHGIYLTGHFWAENAVPVDTCGGIMDTLPRMTLPAVDEIFTEEYDKFEWITFSYAAYAAEKRGGGAVELFACGPCDMPPAKMRRSIWLCAAFGIDRYFLSMEKTDFRQKNPDNQQQVGTMTGWLGPVSTNQPWFEKIATLGDDAKKAAKFALKRRKALVGVEVPRVWVDMTAALKPFVAKNIPWRFYKDGEEIREKYSLKFVGGKPVITRTADGARVGLDELAAAESGRLCVLEKDGKFADKIYAVDYLDGGALIVNFGDTRRELALSRGGVRTDFVIEPDGVVALEKGELPKNCAAATEKSDADWKTDFDGNFYLRPTFVKSKKFEFELKDEMQLDICAREYGARVDLNLDGRPLALADKCTSLFEGLNPFYKTSRVKLGAGRHTLELASKSTEILYMPIAVIAGDFVVDGNTLSKRTPATREVRGFMGKITQTAKIKIPEKIKFAEIADNASACEMFIDGQSLGTKMWRPFVWAVPEKFAGREAEVKLVRYTTFGAVFGDGEFVAPESISSEWVRGFYREKFPKNHIPLKTACDVYFK